MRDYIVPKGYVPIEDCPHWYINREGSIWSGFVNKEISQHDNGSGYSQVTYYKPRKKYYIHILLAKTFIGIIPKGMVVNHKDGNKQNNNLDNLEIVTSEYNNKHAVENGLRKKWRGDSHPNSKFTEEDILSIRNRIKDKESNVSISKDYNVTPQTISDIKCSKSWSWLA